jgi:hypothetical protein
MSEYLHRSPACPGGWGYKWANGSLGPSGSGLHARLTNLAESSKEGYGPEGTVATGNETRYSAVGHTSKLTPSLYKKEHGAVR